MKQMLFIFAILLILFFVFQCDEKKPNNPELEDPSYYYPINRYYKWNYVPVNDQCVASEDDSFAITAVGRNKRPEGSGWDLVSSGGGTTFVYYKGDTIFSKDIGSTPLSSKVLVGPIREEKFWKDERGFEYSIVGFEDLPSDVAGRTYHGCAKVRRTYPGDPKVSYFWWAPQVGKVRREEKDQSDTARCVSGEELRRLDKPPDTP